jgi:hypothetical protein
MPERFEGIVMKPRLDIFRGRFAFLALMARQTDVVHVLRIKQW